MLREAPNGDFIGEFAFKGRSYEYHVRGYGKPVLLTASLSSGESAYAWRYLFECLAGVAIIYSLDLESLVRRDAGLGQARGGELIEAFVRETMGLRSTIISGDREGVMALKAASEARALVDRIIVLSPRGIDSFRPGRFSIAGLAARSVDIMPLAEQLLKIPGTGKSALRRLRSRGLPGGKTPIRVCEDIMRLL